jgi:3-oxoacyl-[acyl-carrier protein] reductase
MKKALITGGSRGLGLAVCRRLLSEGWQVLTASRRLTSDLADLRRESSGRLEYRAVDFARPDEVHRFCEDAGLLDGFDAFVANAAVGTEGLLTLTAEAALRECLEVNVVAPMLLARQVIKGMLNRGGSLVFISSVAARTGFSGLSVYSASKAALVAFSRALAREYGERGIRSNCVLPGFLETDMSASLAAEQRERLVRRTALRRLGTVQDVAGTVSFLLSDDARFITGTEVVVDGGLTA